MKRTLTTLLLAGAALGAAGCGGSKSTAANSGQTITVVEANSSTTTTTATAAKPPTQHPRHRQTSTTKTTASVPQTTPQKPPAPVVATRPTGDAASNCLSSVGLAKIGVVRHNEWAGTDRLRLRQVFVDGPYKSAKLAAKAAASLDGIELSASGGLYAVSAVLTSRLNADVRDVARCLAHAPAVKTNGNSLTF